MQEGILGDGLLSEPALDDLADLGQGVFSRSFLVSHPWIGLLSLHPVERYKGILKGLDFVRARDLHAHVGKRVATIGWIVTGKTVHTKDREPIEFVSFEDTTGLYETVFFPKVYNRFCHMPNEMRRYILKGKVEKDFGSLSLTVSMVIFID